MARVKECSKKKKISEKHVIKIKNIFLFRFQKIISHKIKNQAKSCFCSNAILLILFQKIMFPKKQINKSFQNESKETVYQMDLMYATWIRANLHLHNPNWPAQVDGGNGYLVRARL